MSRAWVLVKDNEDGRELLSAWLDKGAAQAERDCLVNSKKHGEYCTLAVLSVPLNEYRSDKVTQ